MMQALVFANLNDVSLGPAVCGAVWLLPLSRAAFQRGDVIIEVIGWLRHATLAKLIVVLHEKGQWVQQGP